MNTNLKTLKPIEKKVSKLSSNFNIEVVLPLQTPSTLPLPYFSSYVSCGFPSPAEDHVETRIDLNSYLITNPNSTFYARAYGESMLGAGIFDGDILVIDRVARLTNGDVVLAIYNGEFTVKRYLKKDDKVFLEPDNDNYPSILLDEANDELEIWGVVLYVIHEPGIKKRKKGV